MSYFRTCPLCGSNLDPGERCECEKEREVSKREQREEERKKNERVAITYGKRAWSKAWAS